MVKLVTHAELNTISVDSTSDVVLVEIERLAAAVVVEVGEVVVMEVVVVDAEEAGFWVLLSFGLGLVVASASTSIYTSFCTSCSTSTSFTSAVAWATVTPVSFAISSANFLLATAVLAVSTCYM